MNKVILIGRLTRDPEIRTTNTGKKVASFSVAVSEGKDSSGQEITQYFECSAWDKLADIIESYVKKGTRVGVVGALKNRTWDGPDGTKRKATDINVRELEILTSRMEAEAMQSSSPAPTQSGGATASKPKPASNEENASSSDSLPEIDVNDLDDMNIQMPF